MTPACGYLRVSSKGQLLDDADGFPRQRAAIESYAAANGLTIVQWFEERGISGVSEWADRPAWIEMMASMQDGGTVIIERLDRLARDLGIQEYIVRDLKKRRVALISTAEPDLGSADPTRILFRQILGAVAQYDRAQIEAKLRHARDRQRQKIGRCEGRKPFGHRPKENECLDTIIALKRQGYTTRKIARILNGRGLPTRTGTLWHHGTVAKIIRSLSVV